ncbi:hypothetical protein BD414DRAFT_235732 [Trametes punicea]|nr:hypothetical protein BD414DRAFT_235732 [Trametes punicea]
MSYCCLLSMRLVPAGTWSLYTAEHKDPVMSMNLVQSVMCSVPICYWAQYWSGRSTQYPGSIGVTPWCSSS